MKFLVSAGLILASLLCSVQCLPQHLTVSISTDKELKVGEDIVCKVTIANSHDKDLRLLKRNTPLDDVTAPIYEVTRNGKPLLYEGLLFKRLPPTDEEYVSIPAKSSISSPVDLSVMYGFKTAGIYSVKMSAMLQYFVGTTANSSSQLISSNTAVFNLEDTGLQPIVTIAETLRRNSSSTPQMTLRATVGAAKAPYFAGAWSSSDKSSSTTAYNAAYSILSTCYTSVSSNPNLYTKWFGYRYSGYVDTVKGVFLSIKKAMESTSYILNYLGPKCKGNIVAYTYHGSTTLYLCAGYFSAPTTGSDSKMGTIVHEMSHAVAYTEDYKYGPSDCQALAKNYPDMAINNADNYEYFAESLY